MDRRVAIVGYSFRFPQTSQETFWQDLLDGKDLITEVEAGRWSFENHYHPDKNHPGSSYTFKAGSLGDISQFDAEFFGISPREAAVIDPQQRYLLEMTWEALEHSGIKPSKLRKTETGVFIGISSVDYSYRVCDDLSSINASSATGNTSSIASNRISYTFDFQGPSISMDTACSSSMVAFHQACQAIINGDVPTAVTGGISLHMHPFGFIIFSKATMLSPDGRCKVFDESANGYVRSEGGGIFILKDYDQAIADGDIIHAVVAGSSVNTDGYKSGMTIPSCKAQQRLMEKTYLQAGISPHEVDYVEAHGTGTPVGDPIETLSIGNALGQKRLTPLPIGSVKSNLGHLEPASGIAGLVKALLILKHRTIPATISMKTPNPDIKFDEWNIRVVDKSQPLASEGPLTVGVNSFGFGGSNAHVILQSTPEKQIQLPTPTNHTLPLIISGKTEDALNENLEKAYQFIQAHSEYSLYDITWNYAHCRDRLDEAALLYVQNREEALEKLSSALQDIKSNSVFSGKGKTGSSGAVFVYSGNGCQWETMGKKLLSESDTFRKSIDEVDALFSNYGDFSLKAELEGRNGPNRYEYTEIAQPSLFALQVAITEHLLSQGIKPVAVTGHSVGEVAAAWAAGALSLEDAVKVIYHRSHFQGKTKGQGAMTAVGLSEEDIIPLLAQPDFNKVYLAGSNSHRGVTLAGDPEQLSQLEKQLEQDKIFNRRLPLNYAFHSPVMDPIAGGVLESLTGLTPKATHIPYISTVTGTVIKGEELNNEYWWNNIREPVKFRQAIDYLLSENCDCFIEIGAHPVLRSYLQDSGRQHNSDLSVIPTLFRDTGNVEELERAVASAMLSGAFDLNFWFPVDGTRLELPNYAWQKTRHWHPITTESYQLLQRFADHPLLGSPMPQTSLSWENQLDTGKAAWLHDHQVGESVVFPGAGFAELALNAASHFRATDSIEIEDFEILAPLILDEQQSKVIQTLTDPDSGNIQITSRAHAISDKWTLNCKARAVHQSTGTTLHRVHPKLPERTEDFDAQLHQKRALQAGLQYGPAFSAVTNGWLDDNTLLARLELPEIIAPDADRYILHPGMLDSAIQLVIHFLAEQLESNPGTAFVPTRADRITARRYQGKQTALVRVQLIKKSPHSLLTNFELFDADGNTLAVLEGLRYRAVRLYKADKHKIEYLDYQLTPAPYAIGELPFRQEINQVLYAGAEQTEPQTTLQDEVFPLLDSLIEQAIAELVQNSFIQGALDKVTVATLNLQDERNSLLRDRVLEYALQAGRIQEENDNYTRCEDSTDPDVSSRLIWNTLVREYPDYFYAVHLAGRSSLALQTLFREDPDKKTDFEEIHLENFEQFFAALYRPGSKNSVSKLTALITEQQNKLPVGARLGVMEASVHTPYHSRQLCETLNFDKADFCYASHNESALSHFSQHAEEFPLSESLFLNDSDEHQLASTEPPRFQIAIITLDSHASRENLRLLKQIKPLLAEGATLILTGLESPAWLDFAFGHLSTWWEQGSSPLVTAEKWQVTLTEAGFIDTTRLDNNQQGFFLISANIPVQESSTIVEDTKQHWIFVSGQEQISRSLQEELTRVSGHIQLTTLSEMRGAELQEALRQKLLTEPSINRIILSQEAGLDSQPYSSQVNRCEIASIIYQTVSGLTHAAEIVILTQGVSNIYLDQQFHQRNRELFTPADSALWGFTRTMMNESLNNSIRLLDLPRAVTGQAITEAARELLHPGVETELFILQGGYRMAPRLRLLDTITPAISDRKSDKLISLGFELPGQLKSLRWEASDAPQLGKDEVEIEVKATGLNFRDVMYALGLLSDEAIENGFAGATMGLEFSGTILRTGEEVDNFKVGDAVVGFGSACFSNRMIATEYSIAPIPAHLSYEGAATIPTTFLTVYYALHHLARLQPGERILIHGAAGGVGIAAIQIAQWIGAEIYATVGSGEKRDFLELMGVEHIYNSRELTYAEEILNDTPDGRGVDVVLNSLAGEAINQNFRVLKPFGRFLELGKRDFYENTHIGLRPFRNNISYFGIDADQLQKELPELTRRLFKEVIELFEDGELFPLPYARFDANQVVDAFRYMQQAKQIGKIVVTYEQGITPDIDLSKQSAVPAQLTLDPEATYLVTGGLGGFGLKTARWLVEKGARHLLLLSRRGAASEEAKGFLEESTSTGINIQAESCDITDKNQLATVIQRCGDSLPPLKGIVHAATLINDGLILNMTADQISSSLDAKLNGALYLHELTREQPLDLFVLYSSATTLLGNPGQAAYVAANHWLEALAATRKSVGLPATCVRWGAIDDVGFLARNTAIKDALQGRLGGNALNSDTALQHLEQLILSGQTSAGVMELDWHSLSRFLPTASQNKFSEIARISLEKESNDEESLDLKQMMNELGEEEFQAFVLDILSEELSEILMIPVSKIDPDKSIYDMGMDSLMGVELMSALETRIGIQVPVMALTETPKLSQLTQKIISLIDEDNTDTASSDHTQQIEQVVAQHGQDTDANLIGNIAKSINNDRETVTS